MKWIYAPKHPKANARGFVAAVDYDARPVEYASHANIMVDRFYEGARAQDGTDIGSRRKHRAYMKAHGLTTADDFKSEWHRAEQQREAIRREGRMPSDSKRREALERAMYRMTKP